MLGSLVGDTTPYWMFPELPRPVAPRLRFSSLLAAILTLLSLSACGKDAESALAHPPALSSFAWDAPAARTGGALSDQGWQALGQNGDRHEYMIADEAVGEAERAAARELLPEADRRETPPAASLTLFAPDDRLKIARLIRRDSAKVIRAYASDLHRDFGVSDAGPAYEGQPIEEITATGNRITRKALLYETDAAFISARIVYREAIEARLADASLSEIELQFLGKAANEGLNRAALIASLEAE